MPPPLTFQDISFVASSMRIDPCALYAVAFVESSGSGFLPSKRPKILFEGHVFWRELVKRKISPFALAETHPDIVHRTWTKKFYLGGEQEYSRLEKAISIHEEAALCSTSFGMFQIMGFNYAAAGFLSVTEFVAAMQKSSKKQLSAVCAFMQSEGLLRFLQTRDWQSFARRYNGQGYAQNLYDKKLEQAYLRCKEGKI